MDNSQSSNEEQCAVYLKALADPTRLRILRALQAGPLTVSDVALSLEMDLGLVSHHLRTLYHAGLASSQRDGKYIYYSLNQSFLNRRPRSGSLDFGCCKFQFTDQETH